MAMQTFVLAHSTMMVIWGENLALRGANEDNMMRAVEGMREERLYIFASFGLGMLLLQVVVLTMTWGTLDDDIITASLTSFVVAVFVYCFLKNGYRLIKKFEIPEGQVVSGEYDFMHNDPRVPLMSSVLSPPHTPVSHTPAPSVVSTPMFGKHGHSHNGSAAAAATPAEPPAVASSSTPQMSSKEAPPPGKPKTFWQ
eukprot:TRINITY_DN3934_c0_g2_i1.p1 TRINITY_DN3934_c0_g2~~TRINITY_DN3934_c0_g2_i1.p1  ORF type:complete len:197 (-),score=38.71 TRINITY_DN3934_c0_g2_i1:24-614(-)